MKNKNLKNILIVMTMGVLSITNVLSQVTFPTNAWANNRYLGFNNTSGANPLLTRTNNINRMLIFGGTAGNTQGRVALGNNLPNSFLPANRLHLHQDNGNFGIQFTNNNTGITAANGFEMNLYNNSIFQFHQHQMANVNFRMPSSLLMQLTWNNGPSHTGIC